MSPANKPGLGGFGRIRPGARNLIVLCLAVLTGTIVGGFSVLSVFGAVTKPLNRDAPASSAVFTGPHVVSMQAATSSVAPNVPAAPAQPVTPVEGLQKTWPDSLSARARNASLSDSPNPSPSAQGAIAPVSEQGLPGDGRSEAGNERTPSVNSARQAADNWGHFFHDERNDGSRD